MKEDKSICVSLCLETRGEYCVVVKILSKIFKIVSIINEVSREASCFGEYAKKQMVQYVVRVRQKCMDYMRCTSIFAIRGFQSKVKGMRETSFPSY